MTRRLTPRALADAKRIKTCPSPATWPAQASTQPRRPNAAPTTLTATPANGTASTTNTLPRITPCLPFWMLLFTGRASLPGSIFMTLGAIASHSGRARSVSGSLPAFPDLVRTHPDRRPPPAANRSLGSEITRAIFSQSSRGAPFSHLTRNSSCIGGARPSTRLPLGPAERSPYLSGLVDWTTSSNRFPPRRSTALKWRTSRVTRRRTPSSSASATMEASTRPRRSPA